MNSKVDDIDILEAVFQCMTQDYMNLYKVDSDCFVQIEQHTAPNVRRLSFNIAKYRKEQSEQCCVVCSKDTAANIVVAVPAGAYTDYDLPVVMYLCKKHHKIMAQKDVNHKDMAKLNDAFLAVVHNKTENLPENSFYGGHTCYPDVEELVNPNAKQLRKFVASKNGNGFIIYDSDCQRVLYCADKITLLKYYTGYDDFGTQIVFSEFSDQDQKKSGIRGEWTCHNSFVSKSHTPPELITLFSDDSKNYEEIMAEYWEWVEFDINEHNGCLLDLADTGDVEFYLQCVAADEK